MNPDLEQMANDVRDLKIILVAGPREARMIRDQLGAVPVHIEMVMPPNQVLAVAAEDFEDWKQRMDEDKAKFL